MDITENIKTVKNRMKQAAKRSGRNLDDITLIAVTKTVDIQRIKQAISCGVTDIGENRVQELLEKYDKIKGVNWHMIVTCRQIK